MDQKWIQILGILVLFQKIPPGAGTDKTVKEGQQVEINCRAESGSMVVWFRVLDTSVMEFIASFSINGILKSSSSFYSKTFSHANINRHILTLTSFNKTQDSGVYSCASLYKGNELKFGEVTRLVGEKIKVTTTSRAPPSCTPKENLPVSTTACVCRDKTKQGATSPDLFCAPVILGPLAGSCGLLLLLLIITILYCNRIRTRRCPHHYKRKSRKAVPEKQMTNRHV